MKGDFTVLCWTDLGSQLPDLCLTHRAAAQARGHGCAGQAVDRARGGPHGGAPGQRDLSWILMNFLQYYDYVWPGMWYYRHFSVMKGNLHILQKSASYYVDPSSDFPPSFTCPDTPLIVQPYHFGNYLNKIFKTTYSSGQKKRYF